MRERERERAITKKPPYFVTRAVYRLKLIAIEIPGVVENRPKPRRFCTFRSPTGKNFDIF